MDYGSPLPIVVIFVLACVFVFIAMAIQIWACVKTCKRIREEKARLREVEIAASEAPPPYSIVVSTPSRTPHRPQCHCEISRNTQINNLSNQSDSVPSWKEASKAYIPRCEMCQFSELSGKSILSQFYSSDNLDSYNVYNEEAIPPTYQEAMKYLSEADRKLTPVPIG